jgi:hypothetical protein
MNASSHRRKIEHDAFIDRRRDCRGKPCRVGWLCRQQARQTTLATPETGQAAPLRIKGALTYRERIALPPQSRAQIELREGATGEGCPRRRTGDRTRRASGSDPVPAVRQPRQARRGSPIQPAWTDRRRSWPQLDQPADIGRYGRHEHRSRHAGSGPGQTLRFTRPPALRRAIRFQSTIRAIRCG